MKAILTAAWAAVLFVAALPASATVQPEWDARSVKVNYSDLDLTHVPGVAALNRRVTGAVHQVCDGPDFTLHEKMQQRACITDARALAANNVGKAIAIARQQSWPQSSSSKSIGPADKSSSIARQQQPFEETVGTIGAGKMVDKTFVTSKQLERIGQEPNPRR